MVFASYVFLLAFLPPVLAGWWLLPGDRRRLAFLTVASWFFYGWWDWRFVPLMLASTAIDYAAGRSVARRDDGRARRAVLVAALGANLGILAYFKYAGFFLDSLQGLGGLVGVSVGLPALEVALPIGISFYTFNSMSYTIDIYRRRVEPADGPLQFAAFVALFPHLVAGPIVRFTDLSAQLRRLPTALGATLIAEGVFLVACGLVKKTVVADSLAPTVDRLFASPDELGVAAAWMAAVGYTLQLYFDFSGYSDMAIGLALLLGFRFPQNFDAPLRATSIAEFWRRWHMTLSGWLRDYLYIPLGGSRNGRAQTLRNLAIVMLLGGLWHGAAWTFVVWGALHGAYLVIHAVARERGLTPRSAVVNRALTLVAVVAAFVIFRSPDLTTGVQILGAMVGSGAADGAGVPLLYAVGVVVLLAALQVAPTTWAYRGRVLPTRRSAIALGAAAAIGVICIRSDSPFLYFQF